MPKPPRPVLLSAAARVLARAAAIALEDAAVVAGPAAVARARRALEDRDAAQSTSAPAQPAGSDDQATGAGVDHATYAGTSDMSQGTRVTSDMFPAPAWRRRPPSTREPDYTRRRPLPADAPPVPVASASVPLHGAKTYGRADPAEEDNDPHDMTAATRWSLSDPLDLPGVRREEDNDPHDMTAATRWSLSDPLDTAPPRPKYKPARFEPVFIEGEDNDPHDLCAATKWSMGEPLEYDEARLHRFEEDDDPHDLSAATRWSMSDPLDYGDDFRRLNSAQTRLVDDDPHDLTAATRWSLGDPTDQAALGRERKYRPPAFKPVYLDRETSPHDMTAWSMSDPLDFPGTREVRSLSSDEAAQHTSRATAPEEDAPHDLAAATRWSFGDPTDHEMLARQAAPPKYSPPEFKPVFVGGKDVGAPQDDKAAARAARWSMADPIDCATDARGSSTAAEAPAPQAPSTSEQPDSEPQIEPVSPASQAPAVDPTPQPMATATRAAGVPAEEEDEVPAMRSSTVPTSRLGRLFHYGSLGLSLGLGAATEGIRRSTGGGGTGSVFMSDANVRRLVATLGRMRGAALKLGQFMSIQDNNMLPPEIERVLQQVQAYANYMPEWQMERVMRTELGDDWEARFGSFEKTPVAAASIGQVHRATLLDGTPVAVKVQFPGVAGSIASDLANVSLLLRGSAVLPRGLYLQNTIAVAKRELEDECDYLYEAAAGSRFHRLLAGDDIFEVPRVYDDLTTGKVLTTGWMSGRPLSKMKHMSQEQRDLIGHNVLRLCLQELFQFRFMQTDPNWANFLFDADSGKIQLIDFGASREYTKEFMDGWYRLLKAGLDGDRAAMKAESESLGYLTGDEEEVMVNAHIDSMTALASPFHYEGKFPFADQTITDKVRSLIPIMLKHRLTPPPAPTYSLNRKLSGAFLMCSKLGANVDCKGIWEEVVGDYQQGPERDVNVSA